MTAVKLPSDIANCLVNWLLLDGSSAARDGLLMAAPAPDCAFASGPADGMPPRTVVVKSAMADRPLASVSIRVLFRFISSSVSAYTGMQFPYFDKKILCFPNGIISVFYIQYRRSSEWQYLLYAPWQGQRRNAHKFVGYMEEWVVMSKDQ